MRACDEQERQSDFQAVFNLLTNPSGLFTIKEDVAEKAAHSLTFVRAEALLRWMGSFEVDNPTGFVYWWVDHQEQKPIPAEFLEAPPPPRDRAAELAAAREEECKLREERAKRQSACSETFRATLRAAREELQRKSAALNAAPRQQSQIKSYVITEEDVARAKEMVRTCPRTEEEWAAWEAARAESKLAKAA